MKFALIGMPTSGKSTVSRALALRTNAKLIELDELMEQSVGCSLQTLIERRGEDVFIELENVEILGLNLSDNTVLSTGGSVVYATKGMEHLINSGFKIIYLEVEISTLRARLADQRNMRGIVMRGSKTWDELLDARDALYRSYAHHIVKATNKSVDMLVTEILGL